MDDILKKFIEISPNSGFTVNTILESCILCNKTDEICRFTNGIYTILNEIEDEINNEIVEKFSLLNLSEIKFSNKIKLAILYRLEIYQKLRNHKEFLKEKSKFFSSVKHFSEGIKQLYKIVDFIWKISQDKSTNFTFYTKRLTLAVLYKKIINKFISDFSPNYVETEIYIDNQLQKITNFVKMKFKIKKMF